MHLDPELLRSIPATQIESDAVFPTEHSARAARERRGILLAIALAALTHGIWFAVEIPPAGGPPRPPRSPAISFLPPQNLPAISATRWSSPTLMTLPSTEGFSAEFLRRTPVSPPPLKTPAWNGARAPTETGFTPTAPRRTVSSEWAAVETPSAARAWPAMPLHKPFTDPAQPPGVTAAFAGGLAGHVMVPVPFDDVPSVDPPLAWECRVWVELDAQGRVEHAFVLTPPDSKLVLAYLLNKLYATVWSPTGKPGRGFIDFKGWGRTFAPKGNGV